MHRKDNGQAVLNHAAPCYAAFTELRLSVEGPMRENGFVADVPSAQNASKGRALLVHCTVIRFSGRSGAALSLLWSWNCGRASKADTSNSDIYDKSD